jgi:aromatic-L-amino-acid decarboxylase
VAGLQHHIRTHIGLAQEFASWVEADDLFELAAPAPLGLVCFRHVGGDQVNEQLMTRLNRSGKLFITHTKLGDRFTLRLAIGGTYTERRHVEQAWQLVRAAADRIVA